MQALATLLRALTALDNELKAPALQGYTDSELQEIFDALEALQEFKPGLQAEFSRREMTADNFVRS